LFEIYGQKLYGFALKYLKSQTEAEELVQEVFVRVWENRKSLNSDFSFKSYLFTIALNQVRKYFKKRAISLRYLASLNEADIDFDNQTAEYIDYTSVLQRIDQVVASFPERKKQIFLKSRKEGKSSKEIAKELDITVGAVDNQISQAIKMIREVLKNEGLVTMLFVALFLS
jgi:RNA polymerase sigma-70 factor (ECF subfamily)